MATSEELAALREQILALSERYAELAHGQKPFEAGVTVVPPSGKLIGAKEMRYLVDCLPERVAQPLFRRAACHRCGRCR
jgi:hypothetical protein